MVDRPLYEIRIYGRLDASWSDYFLGMAVLPGAPGETLLRGHLPDQAALFAVLTRVRDLGMLLLGVTYLESMT
jgi:hypothetical protein